MTGRATEIFNELRSVLAGRSNLVDSILPAVVFLLVNAAFGFEHAIWASLVLAGLSAVKRVLSGQAVIYALGGIAGVVLAILLSKLSGKETGYFLPGIFSGGLTTALCLVSVVVHRPLVAWTSFVARRWPLEWYWHPQVRPAYEEVTLAWGLLFAVRLLVQLGLFQVGSPTLLAVFNLAAGWPAIILLLIVSYLYGTWRLRKLAGPSVQEYRDDAPPPWQGQSRGF